EAVGLLLEQLRCGVGRIPTPVQRAVIDLPGARRAILVRRAANRRLGWIWTAFRRSRPASPELQQAAALFRFQRFGIGTPRLLAVGQSQVRPWRTESFLLTEEPTAAVPLAEWLTAQAGRALWTGERKQRRRMIREAGRLCRRLHDAGYHTFRPCARR